MLAVLAELPEPSELPRLLPAVVSSDSKRFASSCSARDNCATICVPDCAGGVVPPWVNPASAPARPDVSSCAGIGRSAARSLDGAKRRARCRSKFSPVTAGIGAGRGDSRVSKRSVTTCSSTSARSMCSRTRATVFAFQSRRAGADVDGSSVTARPPQAV